ncbi:hypothetical protein P8452_46228 [Trifolium repens]|nr:hypothetical protein P8452_46228 [Trifolium repens]
MSLSTKLNICNSPIQPTSVSMKRKKDSISPTRDVVKGDNIEVLNIHSRCAKFKLHEENEALSLAFFLIRVWKF